MWSLNMYLKYLSDEKKSELNIDRTQQFHEVIVTRFRTTFENFSKFEEQKELLLGLQEEKIFSCLDNINFELCQAIYYLILPLYKMLCVMGTGHRIKFIFFKC